MLLKDIVERAIYILGLESEVNVNTASSRLIRLTDCANMILQELSLQFVPLRTKETVAFTGGRAYYTDFSYGIREVLEVRVNGEKVPFIPTSQYLEAKVDGTSAEVAYVYYLGDLSLNDCVNLPPKYTEYILATGVSCEYYYRSGLIDEALFYKNRYELAISNLSNRLRAARLPQRRFI